MIELSRDVEDRLVELARASVLLVASDYDGTLSPIVNDPAQARPHREAMVALHNLAVLPRTHVSIISGRSLSDLSQLTGSPGNVHLVGSHGSEFDPGFASRMPQHAIDLKEQLARELTELAERSPGCTVEIKPASVAFHYRNAERGAGERAAKVVHEGLAKLAGVQVKTGKMVVELGVIEADKGSALESMRHRVAATSAIFIGDDVTDEDAFAVLRGPDVGIKVGPGDTKAGLRVDSTEHVAMILARLAELRAAHLAGSDATPIERHTMLSDQRTVALVDDQARVTWMCAPRIDSPSMFSEMLDGPNAGYFGVGPVAANKNPTQRYLPGSLVLETRWPSLSVTDYLDASAGAPQQQNNRVDLVRVLEGTGKARVEFAPRLDFGRVPTRLRKVDGGLVVEGAIDAISLRSPGVDWSIKAQGEHHTAATEIDLSNGPVVLELRCGTQDLAPSLAPESHRRSETLAFWNDWASGLTLPTLHSELMRTSALVLRGLVHGPTGAIAAAATTSLPETLGGVRNWDYRYCWPRDASMTATTLVRLGSTSEAIGLLDWLARVVETVGDAERLAPIYDVLGRDTPPEAEIVQLSGYAGSRPVRIGNAAARQVQLDVFGPIAELLMAVLDATGSLSPAHHSLVQSMASAVAARWREPDHGIWEIRGPLKHHVHTKVMCWVTLDRAAKIAERCGVAGSAGYRKAAEEIREDVLEHGWNDAAGAFTASYGSDELDAAVLTLGTFGLIEPGDPRFAKTVEAIEQHLRSGPTVYRYLYDDGLPGREGGFHICALWLVEAYALVGRLADARSLFDSIAALAGPTGLFSEQHEPIAGVALGNHPQAYSHLGLIEAARRLEALS